MTTLPASATYELGFHNVRRLDQALVQRAMKFIATCSEIDMWRMMAITRIARADQTILSAILGPLRTQRQAAMDRVAKAFLPKEDFDLYEKLNECLEPVEGLRNDLVHRIWAYSPEAKDAIVLIDSAHISMRDAGLLKAFSDIKLFGVRPPAREPVKPDVPPALRPKAPNSHARVVTAAELAGLQTKAGFGVLAMSWMMRDIVEGVTGALPTAVACESRELLAELVHVRLEALPKGLVLGGDEGPPQSRDEDR